jgi:hypothetical protein
MPIVQYVDPLQVNNTHHKGRITRGMSAPIKASSLEHWLKEARKVIHEIPRSTECIIETCTATPKGITYNLIRPNGTRVYVVIDRTRDGMVLK